MIFEKTGKMALGSRMRMLSERLLNDAKNVYDMYGVGLKPKWFPVFYVLSQGGAWSITSIAEEIKHSHPSVVKIVREMSKENVVTERKDESDGRKNLVELSEKGKEIAVKIQSQYTDLTTAMDVALAQTQHNLWEALAEMEYLLDQKSLFLRVREEKKKRESAQIKLVDYTPQYKQHFKSLNEEWISANFTMESSDYNALDHPQSYIIDKGGAIVVALFEEEPVGVCALIPMEQPEYDFELAKMGVSPTMRGKGIGWLLGKAVVEKARELGAKKIYLESNTVLKPAIKLYEKLGFQKVCGIETPYARCNIQMELDI